MKGKPDIKNFTMTKDVSDFLEGGYADRTEKPTPPVAEPQTPEVVAVWRGRSQVPKIFNFPKDLADELRRQAMLRSHKNGFRVTEKDIVITALRAYLDKDNDSL